MEDVNQKDVFSYGDYRQFLRDYFLAAKRSRAGFSLAVVGRETDQSKVAVKWVLDGKRHIADNKIGKWADWAGLKEERREYFRCLVRFGKAKSHVEKSRQFKAMARLKRSPLKSHVVSNQEAGLWRRWYYTAIAELSYCKGFREDPKWIKSRLSFPVSLGRIEEALKFLKSSGYMKGATAVAKKMKTPDEFRSHLYKDYVIAQTELSGKALVSQPVRDRETFTVTVSVSDERLAQAKARIAQFRHEIHDLLANSEEADRVIQINLNLFTLAQGES